MVVELAHDDRALHPEVVRIVVAVATDPAEVRLVDVALDLGEAGRQRRVRQVLDEVRAQLDEGRALVGGHLRTRHPLVGDHAVVVVGPAEVALIGEVESTLGHGRVVHELVDLRLVALVRRQRPHQRQPSALLAVEDGEPCVGPLVDEVGLGAHERGRDGDLPADEDDVERQVVAVELPTPRFGQRRLAEEREVVAVLVHHPRPADELAEEVVGQHAGARLVVPAGRQARPDDTEDRVAHGLGELVEPEAVPVDVELGVGPLAPLDRIDRVADLGPFVVGALAQDRGRRRDHGRARGVVVGERVEVEDRGAIGRHPDERLRDPSVDAVDQARAELGLEQTIGVAVGVPLGDARALPVIGPGEDVAEVVVGHQDPPPAGAATLEPSGCRAGITSATKRSIDRRASSWVMSPHWNEGAK